MINKLKVLTTTFLLSYALSSFYSNAVSQNKKEIPEHIRIFNEAQKIQYLDNALNHATNFIKRITPFPDSLNYGVENYYASFKIINERMRDDCDGDAVAGMVFTRKFNSKMLIISDRPSSIPFQECYFELQEKINSHAICIVKKDGKYYSPGISHNGLNSLKELVNEVGKKFEEKINWKYYWIYDFDLEDLLNADDNIFNRRKLIERGEIKQ